MSKICSIRHGATAQPSNYCTKEIFAGAQQNDEYFAVIYQSILEGIRDYPNFIIKDSVLYRRVYDKHLRSIKFVICLPDILASTVIYTLHTQLGHKSLTANIKISRYFTITLGQVTCARTMCILALYVHMQEKMT